MHDSWHGSEVGRTVYLQILLDIVAELLVGSAHFLRGGGTGRSILGQINFKFLF